MEKKNYTTPFVEVHQLNMDAALLVISATESSSIVGGNGNSGSGFDTFDGYGGIDDEGTLDPD